MTLSLPDYKGIDVLDKSVKQAKLELLLFILGLYGSIILKVIAILPFKKEKVL